MTNKVIQFPKSKVVREIPEEHLKARQAKMDQKMADAIADDITSIVLSELDNNGIEVETPAFMKDFVMVAESIKAAIYRQFGVEHHLHAFADNNVKIVEGNLNEMSPEEIREKIEGIMEELQKAKENLDSDQDE